MLHKTIIDWYKNKSVLITGGCGFIGSRLAQTLVEASAQVTILDNLSTGNLQSISSFATSITFIHGSITDFITCLATTKNQEIIFHLAACTSVPNSIQTPHDCYMTNVTGTQNLLEAARINNVQRFIFASSAAVYGNQADVCHEDLPCTPQSPYGYSKQIGELLCKQYTQNYQLQTICPRYFNVFDEHHNGKNSGEGVVAQFQKQITNNQPITIFGDGMQVRDFVPIQTIVDATITLATLNRTEMNGQAVNIATGKSITMLTLIENLKKKSPGYSAEVLFQPARPGDLKYSYANCSKYKHLSNQ
ncbi:MAG TPA: NAD-dependent epimerase/dehydratase family protein [Candidatus Babeliales bacterium]|nr:NAD-dependent epimerase/dehydratase family protein [Candidatus Babeliales bacterium]